MHGRHDGSTPDASRPPRMDGTSLPEDRASRPVFDFDEDDEELPPPVVNKKKLRQQENSTPRPVSVPPVDAVGESPTPKVTERPTVPTKPQSSEYVLASELMQNWRESLFDPKEHTKYFVGSGELKKFDVRAGRIIVIGGAPGTGKTALLMQLATDALRSHPELRILVANVEMTPKALLARNLVRLSGRDLESIRQRSDVDKTAIDDAVATIDSFADRLAFAKPPFTIERFLELARKWGAHIVILDYIQRVGTAGPYQDQRAVINAAMTAMRQAANTGMCFLLAAAMSRQKDHRGNSGYRNDSLDQGVLRDSSDLEYGADDVYLMVPDRKIPSNLVLQHLKSRNGKKEDIRLHFDADSLAFHDPIERNADSSKPMQARTDRPKGGERKGKKP